MEGLAQANEVLTCSNTEVMAQLAQTNVTMNAMQAQLKTLSTTSKNPTISKRKYYCWSCGRNFTHGSKTFYSKKTWHKKEAYYKRRLRGCEKGCEWQLRAIMNKIKISTPKISSINNIRTPPNSTGKYTLAISDSGTNIHIEKQATPKPYPVIVSKDTTERLTYGSIMN